MTKRHLPALAAAALCATALVAAPAASAKTSAPPDGLQRALSRLTADGAPGAVVLTRRDGTTRRVARGYADLKTHRAMRPDDRFRVGSVTKTFVATVVLQLAGEGKLGLDDSVQRWLPGVVPGGERITVRQLLNHTSGLFNYTDDETLIQHLIADRTRTWTPRELVGVATAHPPVFAPGARWSYSNTGYIVLGMIAEAATGRPIGTELQTRIFAPLHLKGTTFDSAPRIAGQYAHGYFGSPRARDVSVFSPSGAWAAGAIVSTASDVARFYRALLGGKLLRPDMLNAMTTTVPIMDGARYGLGIAKVPMPCGTAWTHDGDFPGYLTTAAASPDGRRQAVVMVNTDSLDNRGHHDLDRVLEAAFCG